MLRSRPRVAMIPPLFNPSNDMALAADAAGYTPPLSIQRMEADLSSLARFWDEGPWGWSRAARRRYERMGVPAGELPSDGWLRNVRRLSSRAFACDYLARLLCGGDWGGLLAGERMRFLSTPPAPGGGPLVFKSPWSGSGRGVVFAPRGLTPAVEARVGGFLRSQGGYVEDFYYEDKRLDFAMEFLVRPAGGVEFLGYSVFLTGREGAYAGNVVAPQPKLMELIGVDEALLRRLVRYHCRHLGGLGYHGAVGIDMMRLADGRVHPVVEINFRRTMGILALTLCGLGLTADADLTPPVARGFQAVVRGGVLSLRRT